jgi:hypothetical protein
MAALTQMMRRRRFLVNGEAGAAPGSTGTLSGEVMASVSGCARAAAMLHIVVAAIAASARRI